MQTNTPMKTLFQATLKKMVGKKCWAVTAGHGSMAVIDIGDKIKRVKPISNKHLSELSRHYEGEFYIHISCCAWRLSKKNAVVCTWANSESQISKLLKDLSGKKIIDIRINDFYDLIVEFQKGYTLHLFCEQVASDNYSIKTPKGWFTVDQKSALKFHPRIHKS